MLKRLFDQRDSFHQPAPGLYHYRRENGDEKARLHLRFDPGGQGTLIVNSSRIMHLNPTAALMTYLLLEKVDPSQAIKTIQDQYDVSSDEAASDLKEISRKLEELVRPDGACPIHDLELDTQAPFSARPTAPYRLDLALTYRCNNDCSHCYNIEHPTKEKDGLNDELSTNDWKQVLDKAWSLGIPHIIFTGGEPTLRDDLPDLIAHAEKNGQITGLNTNGRRLSQKRYVDELVAAGLDHIQITLESSYPVVHDEMVRSGGAHSQTVAGIRNALESALFVMTNTTMLQTNVHSLPETLDFLAELGVPTIGLNALIYSGRGTTVGTGLKEADLTPLLDIARQKTETHRQRLIWYTPTQYCSFDPMGMDLGVKGCTAALYNMCVEPDGGVLPCQSYYHPLGNLLNTPWDNIWNHTLAVSLRERRNIPGKCDSCLLLPECGGGCPLIFETQASLESAG